MDELCTFLDWAPYHLFHLAMSTPTQRGALIAHLKDKGIPTYPCTFPRWGSVWAARRETAR